MKGAAPMQLDLFTSQRAGKQAAIFVMPFERIRPLVQGMARDLLSMGKHDGRRHWQKRIAEIRRTRRAQGFTTQEIDHELDAFARAVGREMDIDLYYRSGPDGAA
jgi:hypothetical protein